VTSRRAARFAALCLVPLLATAAACAGGESTGAAPGSAEPGIPASGSDAYGRALAALNSAAGIAADLTNTQTRLRERCMARKGFTVHPLTGRAEPRTIVPPAPLVASVETARRQGYGLSGAPEGSGPAEKAVTADPFGQLPRTEQDRYYEAMSGPRLPAATIPGQDGTIHLKTKEEDEFPLPDGTKAYRPRLGCEAEVSNAVLADFPRYAWLERVALYGLQHEVFKTAMDAPEPRAARGAWETCMAGKGYPGMTEAETARKKAETFYAAGVSESSARDQEVALAVAHAGCDAETGFETAKLTAWQREYVTYLEGHETDLVAWHEYVKEALARAQRMLSE
jgi:hypothetical protein